MRPIAPPTGCRKLCWRFVIRALCPLAAMLALIGSATTAEGSFKAKLTSAAPAESLSVTLTTSTNEPSGSFLAGQYNWLWTAGPDRPGFVRSDNTFSTFCIEITQFINYNTTYTYTLRPLQDAPRPGDGQGSGSSTGMGALRANMIQELFERNYATLYNGATTDAQRNRRAAAFQMAIWEIVFESSSGTTGVPGTLNVSTGQGAFYLQSGNPTAISDLANSYLATVTGGGHYSAPFNYNLQALSNGYQQDQLVVTPAPAPPGLVLALSGALPLCYWLRRRRTAPQA